MYADTLICSNNLFTGCGSTAYPGSFALRNGRIVVVGAKRDMQKATGPDTRIIDFDDAFICPGFHDAHMHFFHSALYASPAALTYRGTSERDYVEALAPLAARRPTGWLLAQGWRDTGWNPPRQPTKASLDTAYPNRPVALYSGDAHTLWMNSCALRELGISEASAPVPGGSYDRGDSEGNLTGIVREAAAMALMPRIVASFPPSELEDAYRSFLRHLAACGITSVCDLSLTAEPGLDFVRDDIFARLLEREELTCRIHMFPTLTEDESRMAYMRKTYTGERLSVCGFKQFFDGVSSQHTAWLQAPYRNARFEHDCGRPTIDPARMRRLVLRAHREGLPVRIHAIGDQAIHTALDIFQEARSLWGPLPPGRRHCIEHLENFQPGDIARMAFTDTVASVQPMHITLDPGSPEADLGSARTPFMWPFSALLESGALLAFGSDSPVVDVDPRAGLYTAVTRKGIHGKQPRCSWLPNERIGMADAIRAYTLGSACACGKAAELGTLEVGKFADFVVFDRNLLTCTDDDILEAQVLATYVDGQQVYGL